jgi:hypothetical protein
MNLDPLYEAARKTGGQLSFNLSVPINPPTRNDVGTAYDAMPYPGSDIFVFSFDFQQVWWYGHLYRFNVDQAAMVRAIFSAREDGHESVMEDQLLRLVGAKKSSVRQVFDGHPALDEWIVHSPDARAFSIRFPKRSKR